MIEISIVSIYATDRSCIWQPSGNEVFDISEENMLCRIIMMLIS